MALSARNFNTYQAAETHKSMQGEENASVYSITIWSCVSGAENIGDSPGTGKNEFSSLRWHKIQEWSGEQLLRGLVGRKVGLGVGSCPV